MGDYVYGSLVAACEDDLLRSAVDTPGHVQIFGDKTAEGVASLRHLVGGGIGHGYHVPGVRETFAPGPGVIAVVVQIAVAERVVKGLS